MKKVLSEDTDSAVLLDCHEPLNQYHSEHWLFDYR